jgi:hypothetical protein
VQHLRVFVEIGADAVAAELAHDRKPASLCMLLDGMPDVAEVRAGPHLGDAEPQALVGDLAQAPGEDAAVAVTTDQEHPAGVAVVAVLDHRDVQIDDVALLERLVTRNAVTDLVIDRGADRLGVGLVARGA